MKKILLQANIPSGGVDISDGYRQRVLSMADSLRRMGLDVSTLWLFRLQDIFKVRSSQLKLKDKTAFFRPVLPFFLYRNMGKLSRLLVSFWVKLLDRQYNFDCIQAETALLGSICSTLPNKKIVSDFHGDIISEMMLRGDASWKLDVAYSDEEMALKSATGILAASNALIELLRDRHGLPIPIAGAAPCGVDPKRFSNALENRNRIRDKLGLNDKIVFCYLGGLQKWQNIDETIDLFKRIKDAEEKAYLLIITNSDFSDLRHQLSDLGIKSESYNIMALSSAQVPIYLPAADFGFLLRSDSPVNRVASPTKFGEYLCAGLSVITTPFAGDAALISVQSGCGYLLDARDFDNFEQLIGFVQTRMAHRNESFEECRQTAIKHQSWSVTEDAMKDVYTKIGILGK